ncbi:PAS domain-containing protein [Multifurca ochricompacta]|uniref:PAS domain-containing protein n=1 Tax=Multifurca ochricompacta TaxID=376703 RepID=A0AAD4M415_9AGAM|nr:PAS domain-containing protein [Multifurca ochricompacta]
MPFERYLQHPQDSSTSSSSSSSINDHAYVQSQYPSSLSTALDPLAVPPSLHFQMPQFMLDGPPASALGGGAEVLPSGFMSFSESLASAAWVASAGFPPTSSEDVFISPGSKYLHPSQTPESNCPSGSSSVSLPSSSSLSGAVHPHVPPPDVLPTTPKVPPPLPQVNQSSTQAPPLWAHPFSAHTSLGLPVYSSSGFDLLSILGRVATRPNPTITLGPVDMSCSFVVVDVRRYDSPVVYASPSFYRLTGYDEHEVLGRNCRFLQAPGGCVTKGERRQYTAPEAIAHMKKCLADDRECQTSLINYRKDGSAFINLVTIIPVAGGVANGPEEQSDVVFHVGFQVDLTAQPNAILQKLRDGSYMVNYKSTLSLSLPNIPCPSIKDRRNHNYVLNAVSEELRDLLSDSSFVSSISVPTSSAEDVECQDGNNPLSLLLLNAMPDFLLVLSLKGSFLYIAPSISRTLEYSPEEMAGKSVVDYCHPSDIVPLMRELKESSTILGPQEGQRFVSTVASIPKTVNLLFRAKTKRETYIWIECTGRLHVEPGKGRKAIILSARPRAMPRFGWKTAPDVRWHDRVSGKGDAAREVWGMLSFGGTVLFMSTNVKNILGWGVGEIIGMSFKDFILDPSAANSLAAALHRAAQGNNGRMEVVECRVRQKTGDHTHLKIALYPLPPGANSQPDFRRLPIVCQIKPVSLESTVERQLVISVSQGNVFSEQDTAQEGSWQFELQQLKIENQKLAAEVEFLEGSVGLQKHQHRATSSPVMTPSTHSSAEWTSQYPSLKRR